VTAHTPGPWDFSLREAEPNEAFVTWAYGHAAVHGSRFGREANARLIAAAPDLLEALRGLVGTAQQAISSGDWKVDGACDPDLDVLRAAAAISKATGGAA
jgi:hypothetical protein